MGNGLEVAPDLVLPRSMVTQTAAILARKRAGKSNAAVRLAEQMFKTGVPFIVIDPKGDWWGIRSSADGAGPGLPIPILGGSHGDIALTADAGRLVAELVFSQNLTCVLDVSDLEEGVPRCRFLADFGDRLYQLHKNNPRPRHVFLEEAHEVIPQTLPPHAARCRRVWIRIIKWGGQPGIGVTLISQRSASVDKDGLSQIEMLIVMRTTLDRDRAAIRGWIEHHPQARGILAELPGLADGEAYVVSLQWLPDCGLPAVQRVRFHRRETYDSGRTPTLDDDAARPATLASINLGQLADRMAAATDAAALTDPEALLRQIATLQARISVLAGELEAARAQPRTVEVRVPVFADGDIEALRQAAAHVAVAVARATALGAPAGAVTITPPARPELPRPRESDDPAAAAGGPEGGQAPELSPAARGALVRIAEHWPLRFTRGQLAVMLGIKAGGTTLAGYLRQLCRAGYISTAYVHTPRGLITPTPAGLAEVGVEADPAPLTVEQARARWRRVLRTGEWQILQRLIDSYPAAVPRAELAEMLDIGAAGTTLLGYLRTLRENGLITEAAQQRYAADETLIDAAAGPASPPAPAPPGRSDPDMEPLSRPATAILAALARFPAGLTPLQLAVAARYSVRSSSIRSGLSELRRHGYVTLEGTDGAVQAAEASQAAAGAACDPIPDGPELADYWLERLDRAERLILRALLDAWPGKLSKDEVAARTGYSPTSSTLRDAPRMLCQLGLVTGDDVMAAVPELAETRR